MIDMRKYIQYLPSQENIGCCTASATLLAAEIILAKENQRKHFSRLFLYYTTRQYQNRTGLKGASLEDTLTALSLYGVSLDSSWPFSVHRVDIDPHIPAKIEARNYVLNSYTMVSQEIFKNYLDCEIPVIIGLRTGRQFWKLKGSLQEQTYFPVNDTDNRIAHGHAVTIIGYDDALHGGSWLVANSLGLRWGDKGFAAIPYSCTVDIGESFVITKFAGISAGKKFPVIDK